MITLINGKQVNTFNNLSLICPYCGYSEFISRDTFDYDETERKFVCSKCKKSFIGTRMAAIAYETYKCDEDEKEIDEDEFEFEIHGKSEDADDSAHHGIDYNGHEYVDLGLPSGTLWAKCNVGAEKESDYGGYYQWGGTEDFTDTEKNCDWKTYPHRTNYDAITKYNANFKCGVVDNKIELELSDDVAHQVMGGDWHMPSIEQFQELIDYTTSEWSSVNGVSGRKFTSKFNEQSIFIPAAGWRVGYTLSCVGSNCGLWSRSLWETFQDSACRLYFDSCNYHISYYTRCYGWSVRGVIH